VIWASYAFLIGRIGGKAFADQPWLGLLLALGLTVVVSAAIEAARRARAWHLSSSGSSRRARPHDLHTGCTGPGCAGVSTRPVAAEDKHDTGAVQAAGATAHPGSNAVAEQQLRWGGLTGLGTPPSREGGAGSLCYGAAAVLLVSVNLFR
jgi:hypothetical protein